MNIRFIGYGNMAKAIAEGLRLQTDLTLSASSPSLAGSGHDKEISTFGDNTVMLSQADVVILAVKPQKAAGVLMEIGLLIPKNTLLISVVAGFSCSKIAAYCQPDQAIILAMPNTPIAAGKGATALIANDKVSEEQKNMADKLFKSISLTAWLAAEKDLHAITALSGSGPAYVFLFLESLIEGAKKLGMDSELAHDFAWQTLSGSLELIKKTHSTPEALRKKVTSPGGTTEAAVGILQKNNFEAIIASAMQAAYDRALEVDNL